MTVPPLHMTPNEWNQVAVILHQCLPNREVFAFGSRATGKRLKKYSDLDLAVPPPSISAQHGKLVDLATVNPTFHARIEPDFVPLAAFIAATIGSATAGS